MKEKIKINKDGGSYFDSEVDDTVNFFITYNPKSVIGIPDGGTTLLIKLTDSCGERGEEIGNTHYKYNGLSFVKRSVELTISELITDLLNLPCK